MALSRRDFFKYSALGLAGSALSGTTAEASASTFGRYGLFPAGTAGGPSLDEGNAPTALVMGLQLYSVRTDMEKDPLATLKQLSAMGYRNVEHANYVNGKFYGYAPTEFKKILDDLGLGMHSGHTRFGADDWNETRKDFTDVWKQTVSDAATVGQQYVISPWLDDQYRKSFDTLVAYMDIFNKNGELCKKSGLKFGYHNHNFEFSTHFNGMTMYEIILTHTDPTLVAQQIDIGNMYGAGGNAMDLLKKYPGRFELMHVKDEIKSTAPDNMDGYESTVIGAGVMQTRAIADLGRKIGITRHFIIEQESYQDKTALDSARIDLGVMKKWGYQV